MAEPSDPWQIAWASPDPGRGGSENGYGGKTLPLTDSRARRHDPVALVGVLGTYLLEPIPRAAHEARIPPNLSRILWAKEGPMDWRRFIPLP